MLQQHFEISNFTKFLVTSPLPPPRGGLKESRSVCVLYVYRLAYIKNHSPRFMKFSVCGSDGFSHDSAIRYVHVLPVSWMTSCFHMMRHAHYAAFHWARELVFTVFTRLKTVPNPTHRVVKSCLQVVNWRKNCTLTNSQHGRRRSVKR